MLCQVLKTEELEGVVHIYVNYMKVWMDGESMEECLTRAKDKALLVLCTAGHDK